MFLFLHKCSVAAMWTFIYLFLGGYRTLGLGARAGGYGTPGGLGTSLHPYICMFAPRFVLCLTTRCISGAVGGAMGAGAGLGGGNGLALGLGQGGKRGKTRNLTPTTYLKML